MPCVVLILILAFPRVVLVGMWLFTTMLQKAFDTLLIPLLGFLFLPLTTIAYTFMVDAHIAMSGANLLILLVAVLLDLGSSGSGLRRRSWPGSAADGARRGNR